MFRTIACNPYLNLISGLVLFLTAGYETWTTLDESSIGAHHGVLLFSIIHIVQVIPEIMHGFKDINEAGEEIKDKGKDN